MTTSDIDAKSQAEAVEMFDLKGNINHGLALAIGNDAAGDDNGTVEKMQVGLDDRSQLARLSHSLELVDSTLSTTTDPLADPPAVEQMPRRP